MEHQEQLPFISEQEFLTSEYNPYPVDTNGERTISINEANWYRTIIKPSIRNKSRLISKGIEPALNIFSRYEDKAGLEMIAGNLSIAEKYRKIADMEIESINAERLEYSAERLIPVIRGEKIHAGRSPIESDIVYNGGFVE